MGGVCKDPVDTQARDVVYWAYREAAAKSIY